MSYGELERQTKDSEEPLREDPGLEHRDPRGVLEGHPRGNVRASTAFGVEAQQTRVAFGAFEKGKRTNHSAGIDRNSSNVPAPGRVLAGLSPASTAVDAEGILSVAQHPSNFTRNLAGQINSIIEEIPENGPHGNEGSEVIDLQFHARVDVEETDSVPHQPVTDPSEGADSDG